MDTGFGKGGSNTGTANVRRKVRFTLFTCTYTTFVVFLVSDSLH